MKLRGQHGYAMVALMVGLAVLAVLMTVAMPVWKQAAQREREAELIFRGEQYVRAIRLFGTKAGPGALPPSVDVLVQQKYLRKKYKDPITGQDFELLSPASQVAAPGAPGGRGGAGTTNDGRGRGTTPATAGAVFTSSFGGRGDAQAAGGIIGVVSKSKDTSIRLYNGRNHYNEWQFIHIQQVQQAGGAATPGGVAGRGGQPQRGGRGFQGPGGGAVGGPAGGRGGAGRGGQGTPAPSPQPTGPGPTRGFGPPPGSGIQPIYPPRGGPGTNPG